MEALSPNSIMYSHYNKNAAWGRGGGREE